MVLEPSFGDGAFVNALKSIGVEEPKLMFVDIDSRDESHRANFLEADVVPTEYFHPKELIPPPSRALSMDSFVVKTMRAPEQPEPVTPVCLTIGNPPFGKNASLGHRFWRD